MRFRHRREQSAPVPVANPTRIAVLEHDLFGVHPAPGTAAASVIALRRAGTCLEHDPVDVSTLSQPAVICARCGNHLVDDDEHGWRLAITQPEERG